MRELAKSPDQDVYLGAGRPDCTLFPLFPPTGLVEDCSCYTLSFLSKEEVWKEIALSDVLKPGYVKSYRNDLDRGDAVPNASLSWKLWKELKQYLSGMGSNSIRSARHTFIAGLGCTTLVSRLVTGAEDKMEQNNSNIAKGRRCFEKQPMALIRYSSSCGEQLPQASFALNRQSEINTPLLRQEDTQSLRALPPIP